MDATNVPQGRRDRKVSQVRRVSQDLQDLQVRVDHLENKALRESQDLKVRVDHLENKALRENQALQDLLVRLESVLVNAQQFWYQKTTLLKWMIIILGLIVMDRLLSLSPLIAEIVTKLL
jgi:hypothetical protein